MSNSTPPAMTDSAAPDRLPEIYMRYLYEQKKTYTLDFDDVIVFAHHILVNYPAIRTKWQQRMQYVMVDEFQDVSPLQYEIARILAAATATSSLSATPTRQSIRGAAPMSTSSLTSTSYIRKPPR